MKSILLLAKKNNTVAVFKLFCLLSAVFFITGCPNNKGGKNTTPTYPIGYRYPHIATDTTELLVWLDPTTRDESLPGWIDSIKNLYGDVNTKSVCESCDSSLRLLGGAGIANFIQTQTTCTQGKTNCGPSGGGNGIYWSLNFPVHFTDSIYKELHVVDSPQDRQSTESAVVVAVFDTGDDPDETLLKKHFYKAPPGIVSCKGIGGNAGWNFVNDSKDWRDDYFANGGSKHGTVVSGFIVNQEKEYGKNAIKILPVKIHDSGGRSNLYHILCGLAYAQKLGANIINASFGFYAPKYRQTDTGLTPDVSATLLKAYMQHYLTDNKIIMVAAAGNKDDDNEKLIYPSMNPLGVRNLDSVSFYPASLAPELWNVIAATTINVSMVCPQQNYSSHVVDIGVFADKDFVFQNPIAPSEAVIGTSFATPIVSGKIAANYFRIQPFLLPGVPSPSKSAIWEALGTTITQTSTAATRPASQLVNGRVTHKHS